MAKYNRTIKRELIDKNRRLSAGGCNTYSIYNIGNTKVTIDSVLQLLPGEQFEGANENPEIFDYSDIDVVFEGEVYDSLIIPAPAVDQRVIITKSYVHKVE